jgi:fructose-bisphosphate aldolase class II
MIDLSEESVEENLETTAKYLKRVAPMKQFLEMEIGITGQTRPPPSMHS